MKLISQVLLAAFCAGFVTSARAHSATDWLAPGTPNPAVKVGEILPPKIRKPQFPLKDARTLFSDPEIRQARENVARYPAAKLLADSFVKEANYWVGWTDEALRDVVTSPEVPRAFDCCTAGCPVHGRKIFEATGTTYPWIIDPKVPFKVKCPIGGETYPSNDYGKFYRSGFKDRGDFNGPYVDDGRGWVAPDGQRYWFVAHWNHWLWMMHGTAPHPNLSTGLAALGRAYLLTGDARYAHKAAVLLRRIGEVYPNMDHESQSRFGEILAAKGEKYTGKIVNAIWESYLVAQFAETYDAIWPSIDGDAALQKFYGQDGAGIRGFIEANVLEDGIDAYYQWKTRGNYGMHQRSLLVLAIVRQHGNNPRYLASIIDEPGGTMFMGLRYALYSMLWRDGEPYESPEYNAHWVANVGQLATLLPKLGRDVTKFPRLRRLFDAPLEAIAIGKYTPAVGDSFSVYGGNALVENRTAYLAAYDAYRDPRYAQALAPFGEPGVLGSQDFNALLHPPAESASPDAPRRLPPQPSRLLSGYGLGLLNNPADTTALSLYYGLHVTHSHYDRLGFELFAQGLPMMPELGYPDGMNELVAGIYTWSLNTISHNTVTVDASTQPGNASGKVELFADGGWTRAIAVNAVGTYPQCDVYRRTQVMVDTSPGRSYVVDVFEVSGGKQHDYSLHGPPGTFELGAGDWRAQAHGTLAGENVALGEIYDDAKLGAKDYHGGFATYRGSGFQHLEKVSRLATGEAIGDYAHEKNPQAKLRIRILPQPGQEIIAAQARVTPVKYPEPVHFLIARRTAPEGASRFVSVLEPNDGTGLLKSVERHDFKEGVLLVITRADDTTDLVVVGQPGVPQLGQAQDNLKTTARIAVTSFDAAKKMRRRWLADGGTAAVLNVKPVSGEVIRVDLEKSLVTVRPTLAPTAEVVAALVGRTIHFGDERRTVNTVAAASLHEGEIALTLRDDVILGLARVSAVTGARLETETKLILAEAYAGASVFTAAGKFVGRIKDVDGTGINLMTPPEPGLVKAGEDIWIGDVAPGEPMIAPAIFSEGQGGPALP
ncbi:MAG: bacterial Ig-like protein [Verrucomicrobia bacterium]|nr:bacterial Ig-like protein [Verrucomicrobiota bacterium]